MKAESDQKKNFLYFCLAAILLFVCADYVSKSLVQANLTPGESIPIIGNILHLTYVRNFSGFSWFVPAQPFWVQKGFQVLLFLLSVAAFPVYLFYTKTRRHTPWTDIALVFLVSSLLGHSVVDAFFFTYTVDFIQIFHSPCANLADVYAYIGLAALLIEIAQTWKLNNPGRRGIRQYLSGLLETRKEFIDFIRKGFK